MIIAYCRRGLHEEVLSPFDRTQRVGIQTISFTFASILPACPSLLPFKYGKEFLVNKVLLVWAKCGVLADVHMVFGRMLKWNIVLWTLMIAAYCRLGLHEEVLSPFDWTRRVGIQPISFTFASILPACPSLLAFKHGKEFHHEIIRSEVQSNFFLGNGFVDMCCKMWFCRSCMQNVWQNDWMKFGFME